MSEETCEATAAEYAGWWPLPRIFAVHSSGIQSKNDPVCVGFTAGEVRARVEMLARASEAEAREALALGEDGAWSLAAAQAELRALGPAPERVRRILYRPFDWRWTYMSERSGGFLGRPRVAVMRHMLAGGNLGLIYNRQIVGRSVSHFGVTREPICHGTFYLGNRGQDFLAPLYVVDAAGARAANVRPEFAAAVRAATGLELEPEALLHYVFAVVHSATYRARYDAAIRVDFARVPIAASPALLRGLAALGAELVGLHLLEAARPIAGLAEWTGAIEGPIEAVSWSGGHVWIDRRRSRGFAGVPAAVWGFEVGGYAPCEKWLKARRGRALAAEDVAHYRTVVAALQATIAVMERVDRLIAGHGGWPGAFVTGRPA
nr:type ISP restriction/modification enzyme [Nannocystis pusilla]